MLYNLRDVSAKAQGLSRKGLHATAFEVAKVLLMLDADDPMGALFCIDYFALRSHNYRWLQVSTCAPQASYEPSVPRPLLSCCACEKVAGSGCFRCWWLPWKSSEIGAYHGASLSVSAAFARTHCHCAESGTGEWASVFKHTAWGQGIQNFNNLQSGSLHHCKARKPA